MTVEQLEQALQKTPIVAVQNLFNLQRRHGGPMPAAEQSRGGARGVRDSTASRSCRSSRSRSARSTAGGGSLDAAAKRLGCSPAQLAIAWLLARSPVMLPIPGTSKVAHLEENVGAVHVALDPTTIAELAPNGAS